MFKRADRGGVYYIQENGKNNPKSLNTTDKAEAQRLLDAKNGAVSQTAALNLQIGKPVPHFCDSRLDFHNILQPCGSDNRPCCSELNQRNQKIITSYRIKRILIETS